MPKSETFLRISGTDRRNRNVLTDKLLRQAKGLNKENADQGFND